ncbi:MAG: dihydrodipicolinate synthase family protein [Caldilineaceae bacterium]
MIHGILPALITPMTDDGAAVNYDTLAPLVDYLIERGCTGFFVCGGTGEGLLLTAEERRTILEIVMAQAKGRAAVVAHIGAMATQDARAAGRARRAPGRGRRPRCRPSTSRRPCRHRRTLSPDRRGRGRHAALAYQILRPPALISPPTSCRIHGRTRFRASSIRPTTRSQPTWPTSARWATSTCSASTKCWSARRAWVRTGPSAAPTTSCPPPFALQRHPSGRLGDGAHAASLQSNRVIRALLNGPTIAGLKAILTSRLPSGASPTSSRRWPWTRQAYLDGRGGRRFSFGSGIAGSAEGRLMGDGLPHAGAHRASASALALGTVELGLDYGIHARWAGGAVLFRGRSDPAGPRRWTQASTSSTLHAPPGESERILTCAGLSPSRRGAGDQGLPIPAPDGAIFSDADLRRHMEAQLATSLTTAAHRVRGRVDAAQRGRGFAGARPAGRHLRHGVGRSAGAARRSTARTCRKPLSYLDLLRRDLRSPIPCSTSVRVTVLLARPRRWAWWRRWCCPKACSPRGDHLPPISPRCATVRCRFRARLGERRARM